MLELSAPLWLLGLPVVALVWWLHRFRRAGEQRQVPALFLWPHAVESPAPGPRRAAPDPAWRLRALLAAALLLALAGPGWVEPRRGALELWVDDSLSMQVLEQGQSRLQRGLSMALQAAAAERFQTLTLRSLGDPAASRELAPDGSPPGPALLRWIDTPRGRPAPPAPVLMRVSATHWVLTDGADATIASWLETAPVSRLLQVGRASENVALGRLAVRPSPSAAGDAEVLVEIANRGTQGATRVLQLRADGQILVESTVQLAPHASTVRRYALRAGPSTLEARLAPADAMPADDELRLDFAPLAVWVANSCDRHLVLALRAHPRLTISANPADARLQVHCGPTAAGGAVPALVIDPGLRHQPLGAPLRRLDDSQGWPALDHTRLRGEVRALTGRALLASGERTLVALDDSGDVRRVEVAFDLADAALVTQPEFPQLVDALVGTALGQRLLDSAVSTRIELAESDIAPQPLPAAHDAGAVAALTRWPLEAPLLGLAIALMLADAARFVERSRERRHAPVA